ncbi:MAG: hypothetical protein AAFX05_11500, partial [Planctomycetota bacterium]
MSERVVDWRMRRYVPTFVLGASAVAIAGGTVFMAGAPGDFLDKRYKTIPVSSQANGADPPWGPEPVHLRDTSTEQPPDPPNHTNQTDTHDGWSHTHKGASRTHWENSNNHTSQTLTHGATTFTHQSDTEGINPACCPSVDRHRVTSEVHSLASSWNPVDVDIHTARSDTHSVGSDFHSVYSTTHEAVSNVHLSYSTTHTINSNIHTASPCG